MPLSRSSIDAPHEMSNTQPIPAAELALAGDGSRADSGLLGEFERARLKQATAPTVRRDLACLSSIFSRAEEWEWVTYNPVKPYLRGRTRCGLKESEPRTRWLRHEEEDVIIPATPAKAARAIIFAIDTACAARSSSRCCAPTLIYAASKSRQERDRQEPSSSPGANPSPHARDAQGDV
jgi:hypothetical protein